MSSELLQFRDKASECMRGFLIFCVFAGLGWLLDFGVFVVLVKAFGISGGIANFVSSYAGVSFVYFTSLEMVFKRSYKSGHTFLLVFWGFQLFSIMAYSRILVIVANLLPDLSLTALTSLNGDIAAKIVVTPSNLLTNFLFMKVLTGFMRRNDATNV